MHGRAIYPLIGSDRAGNAQDPALQLRHLALTRRQVGFQQRGKAAIPVSARQPGGNAIGVVLVARAVLTVAPMPMVKQPLRRDTAPMGSA